MCDKADTSLRPPSLARADWLIRPQTQAVLAAIAAGGFSARVVGGAVRNALMGRPVKDVDVATTATPEDVMALAAATGLAAVPTGIAHGTVTVLADHVPFEVTTLRHDVETFGRHARVAFTEDWAADARRRDFTFNALYCDAGGDVLDPLAGFPDLVARRVRFIGDPVARIREDYLRILRYFRFHAEYADGDFDAPSLAACAAEREGLGQLSGERIRAETLRLLAAPGALASVRAMGSSGILAIVLGADAEVATFARLTGIEHGLGRAPDPVLRLAALVSHPAADIAGLKQRLRLSSQEADRLERLLPAKAGPLWRAMADGAARAALYRLGATHFVDLAMLTWATGNDAVDDAQWQALATLPARWAPPGLPARGADLVARGVPPGPAVGRILADFETWWIGAGFPDDPQLIARRLDEIAGGAR